MDIRPDILSILKVVEEKLLRYGTAHHETAKALTELKEVIKDNNEGLPYLSFSYGCEAVIADLQDANLIYKPSQTVKKFLFAGDTFRYLDATFKVGATCDNSVSIINSKTHEQTTCSGDSSIVHELKKNGTRFSGLTYKESHVEQIARINKHYHHGKIASSEFYKKKIPAPLTLAEKNELWDMLIESGIPDEIEHIDNINQSPACCVMKRISFDIQSGQAHYIQQPPQAFKKPYEQHEVVKWFSDNKTKNRSVTPIDSITVNDDMNGIYATLSTLNKKEACEFRSAINSYVCRKSIKNTRIAYIIRRALSKLDYELAYNMLRYIKAMEPIEPIFTHKHSLWRVMELASTDVKEDLDKLNQIRNDAVMTVQNLDCDTFKRGSILSRTKVSDLARRRKAYVDRDFASRNIKFITSQLTLDSGGELSC